MNVNKIQTHFDKVSNSFSIQQLCGGGGIRVKILIISGMNESLTYLCLLVFCPQKLGWLSLAERQEEMIEHAMRQTLTGGIANRISVRAHDSQLKSIKALRLDICLFVWLRNLQSRMSEIP